MSQRIDCEGTHEEVTFLSQGMAVKHSQNPLLGTLIQGKWYILLPLIQEFSEVLKMIKFTGLETLQTPLILMVTIPDILSTSLRLMKSGELLKKIHLLLLIPKHPMNMNKFSSAISVFCKTAKKS